MIVHVQKIFCVFIVSVLLAALSGCKSGGATHPTYAQVIHLLDGNDLKGYYTFLKDDGRNRDTNGVFEMTNGVLRISGQHLGYLATKREYGNYRLVAEFKWGNATWAPYQFNARQSGILLNIAGKDHIWPQSIECLMVEGATGSILVTRGAHLTVDGVAKGPKAHRFDRPGHSSWRDELGFRGPDEIEHPSGEWNTLEIVNTNGSVRVTVNGHKTLEGSDAKPGRGKIALQSNGAEVFFRKLDVYPIR